MLRKPLSYKFWHWVMEYAREALKECVYHDRKCATCLRWSSEARIVRVKNDGPMHEQTQCGGCLKWTRWNLGSMLPFHDPEPKKAKRHA